jgi:hypothetical protein
MIDPCSFYNENAIILILEKRLDLSPHGSCKYETFVKLKVDKEIQTFPKLVVPLTMFHFGLLIREHFENQTFKNKRDDCNVMYCKVNVSIENVSDKTITVLANLPIAKIVWLEDGCYYPSLIVPISDIMLSNVKQASVDQRIENNPDELRKLDDDDDDDDDGCGCVDDNGFKIKLSKRRARLLRKERIAYKGKIHLDKQENMSSNVIVKTTDASTKYQVSIDSLKDVDDVDDAFNIAPIAKMDENHGHIIYYEWKLNLPLPTFGCICQGIVIVNVLFNVNIPYGYQMTFVINIKSNHVQTFPKNMKLTLLKNYIDEKDLIQNNKHPCKSKQRWLSFNILGEFPLGFDCNVHKSPPFTIKGYMHKKQIKQTNTSCLYMRVLPRVLHDFI